MLRRCLIFLATIVAARAAVLPEQLGDFQRSAPKSMALPDQALYTEYGLEATEQADYISIEKRFTVTAWRFHDSTGAMALFEFRRPSGAVSKLPDLTAQMSDGVLTAFGNYLLQITGQAPEGTADQILARVPKLERAPLPALIGFLPPSGLIPNSERYIVGPVSLEKFEPRISPSLAAFHLGSEAQLGKYRSPKGEMSLVIFNYPTPTLAREREMEFQKIAGAVVKRSGPLVAAIVSPPDADAAERVLAAVRYEANLTLNEQVPKDETKGFANLILNIFAMAGVLIGLSVIVGLGFGGFKVLLHRLGLREDPGAMTVLDLAIKPGDKTGPR